MHAHFIARAGSIAALAACCLPAAAANFTFSGNATYNTDVVKVAFTLSAEATDLRAWTDSWAAGLNFDPTLTLWAKSGTTHQWVAANDDNDGVGADQGAYDAGLAPASLAAGRYLITLGAAPNYANGDLLSDGFAYTGTRPILISEWNQPGYDINANDQKGTFWRLNLAGVDSASAVPEPATFLLMLLGTGLFLRLRGRS